MRPLPLTASILLLTGAAASAWSQAAPQPFLAPPRLPEKTATQLQPMRATLGVPSGPCKPDGDITRDGNVISVRLVAEVAPNEINNPSYPNGGKDKVSLRSYGGCLTGPVIEAAPGNTLRVYLKNDLSANDPSCTSKPGPGCFNTINIHYHGLHVSPTGNSDNVLLSIAPQTSFQYEINIPEDHPSGTFWYHPHRHGSTALQVASGASGALIIRGNRPYTGGKPGDIDTILKDATGHPIPEQILLFQQIPYACLDSQGNPQQHSDGSWYCNPGQVGVVENFNAQLASPTVWDYSGRFTSINGVVQPTLTVPSGQIQRWRMIHGGIHDTVNVQIVPMVNLKNNTLAAQAFRGVLRGTPKQQAAILKQICPVTIPDGSKTVDLVPQFEIASDGLTRTAILPIGVGEKSVSGGIGTNFLQPGYRSDVLVVFPHPGTYCVLNQAATPDERPNPDKNGGGGQGPNETQLLATVIATPGTTVTGDPSSYIEHSLYTGNQNDPGLPHDALEGLLKGDLTPWRGMPEEGPASNSSHPRSIAFFIGYMPTGSKNFGFWVNDKMYDPDYIDPNLTLQVGATEDWVLSSSGGKQGEPHIFHIHVNPFEVMDVTHDGKSIFGPNGECLVPPDSLGLENQYCSMWHAFRDTVFVQNGYEVHIRTTYRRYIGEFVLHCHILDHEDSGMMANVLIVPDKSQPNGGLGMPGMKMQFNGTMTQPKDQ